MPDMIRDGTGRGYKAQVNSDNQLVTRSVNVSSIQFESEMKEKAFFAYGKRNFVAASANENIFYLSYTGDGKLHVEQMTFSTNSTAAKIELYFDATSVSGGESYTALNVNRASGQTSETTILHGGADLTGTVDDANEFLDIRLNSTGTSTFTYDFRGGIILTKNQNLLVLGEVSTIADKIRTMIFFFEEL